MKIGFNSISITDFNEALKKEWLETNGLGGWASSTIVGAHTRRYHGLLVAATQPPVGRAVLLSKLDESILVNGQRFDLGCNVYPGAVHPHGFESLDSFERDLFPVFVYETGGVRIRKTIAALNGENTTLILYDVLGSSSNFTLELQPFVAGRDFHSLTHANDSINRKILFQDGLLQVRPYDSQPELFIHVPQGEFDYQPDWYHLFEYRVEQSRGLDFQEDLFTYGRFRVDLTRKSRLGVIISTANPAGRDAFKLYAREKSRRETLLKSSVLDDDLSRKLTLAADQFIVRRGQELRTLIAGYHWFADWGRDTMIALPGICLATGRFEDAKRILRAFAQSVSQGMLPNRFPDVGEEPEYNTVDGTLWYFVATYKYFRYNGDKEFVKEELLPVLLDILAWHDRGTRYNIHVADDGLLVAGEPGVQLTWMDAKIGDWVVTPRQGKAVEINSLWYNALEIIADLAANFGMNTVADTFTRRARTVKARFQQVFWDDKNHQLYDVVDEEHCDTTVRPNQLFALSLPFPLMAGEKARQILRVIEDKLYTPFGLRSLAGDDPNYRPQYGGSPFERDSAYHQGTVWSWLIGPYITALVRVRGSEGLKQARKVVEAFTPHLHEAGVGTISEIFDADPPLAPHGCIAQAWSVGEILRAYLENLVNAPVAGSVKSRRKTAAPKTPEITMEIVHT